MIQRIQSIYLVLASAAMFLSFLFTIVVFEGMGNLNYQLGAFDFSRSDGEIFAIESNTLFILFTSLAGGVFIANVLMFRNLKLQRQIGRLLYLIVFGSIGSMFFMVIDNMSPEESTQLTVDLFHIGFYLPFVALILNFMANKGMRRDQQLLNSLDRLR